LATPSGTSDRSQPSPLRGVCRRRSAIGAAVRSGRRRTRGSGLSPGSDLNVDAGCAAACSRAGPPRDGGSHSSGGCGEPVEARQPARRGRRSGLARRRSDRHGPDHTGAAVSPPEERTDGWGQTVASAAPGPDREVAADGPRSRAGRRTGRSARRRKRSPRSPRSTRILGRRWQMHRAR